MLVVLHDVLLAVLNEVMLDVLHDAVLHEVMQVLLIVTDPVTGTDCHCLCTVTVPALSLSQTVTVSALGDSSSTMVVVLRDVSEKNDFHNMFALTVWFHVVIPEIFRIIRRFF